MEIAAELMKFDSIVLPLPIHEFGLQSFDGKGREK
jgi:hypothetical protein